MFKEYPKNWDEIKEKVKLRDGRRCLRCGSTDFIHIHHVIPLSKGGKSDSNNLITLCERCHLEKHPYLQASLSIRLIYFLNNKLQYFLWKLKLSPDPKLIYAVKYFGFKTLLPNQKEPIKSVLNGNDTLIVMPTGSGKSLCYWLPSIMLKEGFTLVISPLIALMQDQVMRLIRLGIPATFINSTISKQERLDRMDLIKKNMFRFVYIAPERFNKEFLDIIRELKINIFVVDEAHCVDIWGDAFRPDYMRLKDIRKDLGNPPIVALTATANKSGQEEICKRLGLVEPHIFVSGFNRPNISLNTLSLNNKEEKLNKLLEILSRIISPGIIYTATIKETKEIYEFLSQRLQSKRIAIYHGEMNPRERELAQDEFLNDNIDILISTKAFGMGIDKKNIRFIIHFALAESLIDYYQEIGRAGRDGSPSLSVLLFNEDDIQTREFLLSKNYPDKNRLWQVYLFISKIPGGQSYLLEKNDETDKIIKILAKEGCISYEYVNDNGSMKFKVTRTGELNSQGLDIIFENFEKSEKNKSIELSRMVEYIKINSCKRKQILSYFGEKEKEINLFLRIRHFLTKPVFAQHKLPCCNVCSKELAVPEEILVNKPMFSLDYLFSEGNLKKIRIWYNEIKLKGDTMNDKRLNYILHIIKTPIIFSIVMLLFAMYPIKIYGYFVFLRLVVFATTIFSVFVNKKLNRLTTMWFSVFLALLFNPFIPIYLTKKIWIFVDIFTILFLLRLWLIVKSSPVSSKKDTISQQILCRYCKNTIGTNDIFCSKCGRRNKVAPFQPSVKLERNPELLGKLKQWRFAKAKQLKIPPYFILHDTTLILICNLLPYSKEDLIKIKGIGVDKINKYGDEIVSLLSSHLEATKKS